MPGYIWIYVGFLTNQIYVIKVVQWDNKDIQLCKNLIKVLDIHVFSKLLNFCILLSVLILLKKQLKYFVFYYSMQNAVN